MNDPFEHHGVSHLSASSINEYIQNPARWLLHVSGYRDNIGIPAMWRGKAVDQAITAALLDDLTDDQAIHEAQEAYARDEVDALSDGLPVNQKKAQSEGEAVERYLRIALPHYRSLGKPIASQKKITLEYDWLSVPIIGYLDLLYDGVVRDIKTVGRLPSAVPQTVSRQLSIYATAEQALPIVDYIHSTKSSAQVVVMPVPDVEIHIKVVEQAARQMQRLLSYSSDIQEVAQLLMPDFDDWRWSEQEKNAARKLWSL
tara:strand:- start:4607 stop:5377 length:771 start_codon:yes stop_codon:yes gene_type:complete